MDSGVAKNADGAFRIIYVADLADRCVAVEVSIVGDKRLTEDRCSVTDPSTSADRSGPKDPSIIGDLSIIVGDGAGEKPALAELAEIAIICDIATEIAFVDDITVVIRIACLDVAQGADPIKSVATFVDSVGHD